MHLATGASTVDRWPGDVTAHMDAFFSEPSSTARDEPLSLAEGLRHSAEPVRVGVVGGGYWGSKHLRILQGLCGVDLAIIERDPERRMALSESFPSATSYGRLDDALDHIDAAIVATPPRSHKRIAERLLESGKDVLVEKPLATSVAESEELIAAAEAQQLILMSGHTFEYNPAVQVLRHAVDSGELGELHYIDSSRLNLGLYQSDVNVLWDLAPHDISIINYLLRSEPTQVEVWATAHAQHELEDVAYLRLHYELVGVIANIHVSWLYPRKVRQTAVIGNLKMAVYDDMDVEQRVRIYDKSVAAAAPEAPAGSQPMSYRYGGIRSPFVEPTEPLAIEDQHFIDCIRSRKRPSSDGHAGLRVVRVLEAADKALATGRPVQVGAPGAGQTSRRVTPSMRDLAVAGSG